ncbi:23S rRNA (uracil(1939)-C(5))-methyltransferase RlmD [Wohlfahrtiimonas chitiniclastica]|uniref:23S rRNA (uracil(1939)-C(5))-methyltransferase RlmD n=1 Tax=Wohlfahrtiimonas chitiniclastica TaxID=400946 RepID=UPI0007B69B6B|nr:23S rRNA (uracil(1939)-C(5))-methyltransferase RlmD [Wohlfahrtiimonas chitiniclastica]KZX37163.1 23S rRNA (uracil(1939)-C(5))-methyltransferase [Wohlfahrtiimonas chitiniclastica]MBS7817351.1 23S rRNA (uracil(1939)-C(5))-methyltransferase RlmD [Wohlfahrtiimonas chitiniclastica]MBS7823075.1 23S rRNA (uracil(1939)-C(5))-methyltransferase RlmD [Wohlfahrtiimonas chitiniclastica]MBS7830889.1 23S rRNA (uracil(1939)-C(5))-methyltransferase RlmD [Wohlfahrtiimonas chitiniclastica]MBS7832857.1 23S rRN
MAKRRHRQKFSQEPFEVAITDITHDGRGVAHVEGKVVFVNGALPDEVVMAQYVKSRKDYDEAKTIEVLKASPDRVAPICDVFGICGGCSLQHLDPEKQIYFKAKQLASNLKKQAKLDFDVAEQMPPLRSPSEHYRYKARLGVKYVAKKEKVLVGFREKFAPFIVDMDSCPVLEDKVANLLPALSTLIGDLTLLDKIPQIEVAIGSEQVALSFRVLETPTEEDEAKLKAFGIEHNILIYLQPKNEASTYLLSDVEDRDDLLNYQLLDRLTMAFKPYHFTQVNPMINQQMVKQALDLLKLQKDETVLDLFCGLGNFTLPLALEAGKVIGVEGDQSLTEWAAKNAARNGLENVDFYCTDLTQNQDDADWMQLKYDAILVDPPRSGALEMMPYLGKLAPKRILYVSCHPATLARDLAELVQYGYEVTDAGVMDMFPHTAHVESMALLVKK